MEKKEKRWDEYKKRWRKGRMEMEGRGGGINKKEGGSHCGKKRGKRETENKTAKQPRMERKN